MAQEIKIREESEAELLKRLPAGTVIKPPVSLAELRSFADPDMDEDEMEQFVAAIYAERRADRGRPLPILE